VSSGIPGGRRRVGRSANRPEPFLVLGITGLIFAVVFGLIAYTVVAYRGLAEDDGEERAQSAARCWPGAGSAPDVGRFACAPLMAKAFSKGYSTEHWTIGRSSSPDSPASARPSTS
jgi:hypothetical protein